MTCDPLRQVKNKAAKHRDSTVPTSERQVGLLRTLDKICEKMGPQSLITLTAKQDGGCPQTKDLQILSG